MKRPAFLSKLYLLFLLLVMYLPTVMVVIYSFNDSKSSARWAGFTTEWYGRMLQNTSLMDALKNSLIVAVCSCLLAAVIGTLGAVGIVRAKLKWAGVLENIAILPIMVPEIILGMAFLAFFTLLGLPFGLLTLILAHTTFCIPYIFLVVKGRLAGLDPAIGEAARDLGAGELRMFWDITLPLIAPAVVSGTLLAFAMSLDDVVISFFITGPATNTLPIKIYSQVKVGVSPEINALCTVMLLVTLALVILASRIGNGKNQKKNRMEDEL